MVACVTPLWPCDHRPLCGATVALATHFVCLQLHPQILPQASATREYRAFVPRSVGHCCRFTRLTMESNWNCRCWLQEIRNKNRIKNQSKNACWDSNVLKVLFEGFLRWYWKRCLLCHLSTQPCTRLAMTLLLQCLCHAVMDFHKTLVTVGSRHSIELIFYVFEIKRWKVPASLMPTVCLFWVVVSLLSSFCSWLSQQINVLSRSK